MAEQHQDQDNSQVKLNDLLAILTDANDHSMSNSVGERSKTKNNEQSTQSISQSVTNQPTSASERYYQGRREQNSQGDQELEILQSLLGKSEIDKIKEKVIYLQEKIERLEQQKSDLTEKYSQLKHQLEQQDQVINNQNKIFSNILSQNLTQLKKDLLVDMTIILEKFAEENLKTKQNFSFKIRSLSENSD